MSIKPGIMVAAMPRQRHCGMFFANRSKKANDQNRLKTIVPTMAGKHGKAKSHTEMPRKTLVDALQAESQYHTTQDLITKNKNKKMNGCRFEGTLCIVCEIKL